jgi:hypothetical protein
MNARANCLPKIPGRYIVDAMNRLPPCGPGSPCQQLGVELPIWGRFEVTFRPFKQVHGGGPPTWTWTATEATPNVPAEAGRSPRPR